MLAMHALVAVPGKLCVPNWFMLFGTMYCGMYYGMKGLTPIARSLLPRCYQWTIRIDTRVLGKGRASSGRH